MLSFTLPDPDAVSAAAARLGDGGLELLPAGVAAAVLVGLASALVITALRRREIEREHPAADRSNEGVTPDIEKVAA